MDHNNHQFQQVSDIQGKVRRDGEYHSLKEFITPDEPLVRELASTLYQGGNFIKDTQDFIHSEVKYRYEKPEDLWKFPIETLMAMEGDCEDMALLYISLARNYIPAEDAYVAAGQWGSEGHAWCLVNCHVVEATASSSKPVNESSYEPELFFNDVYAYMGETTFGFITLVREYRSIDMLPGDVVAASSNPGEYRYPSLPQACRCQSCGYVLENPGKHCGEMSCPVCGGRLWRVK